VEALIADDVQLKYLHIYGINTWVLSPVTEIRAIKFYDRSLITWVYCLTLEGGVATNYVFVIRHQVLVSPYTTASLYVIRPIAVGCK